MTLDEAEGIILFYQLVYVGTSWHINNYETQMYAPTNTPYVLIGDLNVYQLYKVKIAAVTIAGVGKFSDFVLEEYGECQCIVSITHIIPCRLSDKLHKRDHWQFWGIMSFDYIIFN